MFDSFQDVKKYTESLGFESQGLILKNTSNNVRKKFEDKNTAYDLLRGILTIWQRYLNL